MDPTTSAPPETIPRRLAAQGISPSLPDDPVEIVRRLSAVQAQDYAGSKWSIGLRGTGLTDTVIDEAIDSGAILRTHVLRPTWHFVLPADIRWLLDMTRTRVHALNRSMYRKLELEGATMSRGHEVITRALEGGNHRTREELGSALGEAGIPASGQRLAYIVMAAELDALICSGPRRGKQFTYGLLDERAPEVRVPDREAGLAELARRFFTARGPATSRDLAKWSSLTVREAQSAVESVRSDLLEEKAGGESHWSSLDPDRPTERVSGTAHLLSIYDEYLSSYKEHGGIVDREHAARLTGMGAALSYVVLVDGRIAGTWRRTIGRKGVNLVIEPFEKPSSRSRREVDSAARRFGRFLELPVSLEWTG